MRLLKRRAVEAKTGKSKSAIYTDMARGIFPKPVSRSRHDVAWVDHELDHLIEIEIKARDLGLRGEARNDFIRAELANGKRVAASDETPDPPRPARRRAAEEVR